MFPKAPSKIPRKAFLRRLIGLAALPWWALASGGPEEQRMVYAGPSARRLSTSRQALSATHPLKP